MSTCTVITEAWKGGKCLWTILSYIEKKLVRTDTFRSYETAYLYAFGVRGMHDDITKQILRPVPN